MLIFHISQPNKKKLCGVSKIGRDENLQNSWKWWNILFGRFSGKFKLNNADFIMAPGGKSLTDALKNVQTFSYLPMVTQS